MSIELSSYPADWREDSRAFNDSMHAGEAGCGSRGDEWLPVRGDFALGCAVVMDVQMHDDELRVSNQGGPARVDSFSVRGFQVPSSRRSVAASPGRNGALAPWPGTSRSHHLANMDGRAALAL